MEKLPADLCLKIFCCLDHQNLAAAQLVCRKWRNLASDDILWSNLFNKRWGIDHDRPTFDSPVCSKPWKDIYIVQERCHRFGLGWKIIREGDDYFLIHKGEIQRHLVSRRMESRPYRWPNSRKAEPVDDQTRSIIVDSIIFVIGDMENASMQSKRSRLV
ncbi:F-box/WD repeat-containing protein [Striga asiatica]|uniref:F-box protein n=1 Tax=Striga asiatica TaxID=4170 RepID=A0A5A7PL33_STRAF|nr:F-box/WD repeat-containing protein [Striga asiatica]